MSDTGRDPYLALSEMLGGKASSGGVTLGKVLSLNPLRVRADGLDLDGDALYVAQHLLPGWMETVTGLNWEVKTLLPKKRIWGKAIIGDGKYPCYVDRLPEMRSGHVPTTAVVTHGRALAAGDFVLLLRSEDGQNYFLVERLVNMDGYTWPADPPPGGWPVEDGAEFEPDGKWPQPDPHS